MQQLHEAIIWLNSWLWGPPMLILLVGTHLFLTFRLKIIQRYLWVAIKLSFSSDKGSQGDISQLQVLDRERDADDRDAFGDRDHDMAQG